MLGVSAPPFAVLFKEQMEDHYNKNKEALIAALKAHEVFDGKQETCHVYNMSIKYNYKVLRTQVDAAVCERRSRSAASQPTQQHKN